MRDQTAHSFPFQVPPLLPGPRRWTLEVLHAGLPIRTFHVATQGVIIDRSISDAQIIVDDPRISMRHAWVGEIDGRQVVADLGTTNGTFVNATDRGRVTTAVLRPGDVVILVATDALCLRFRP